jgi:hypothetical protein
MSPSPVERDCPRVVFSGGGNDTTPRELADPRGARDLDLSCIVGALELYNTEIWNINRHHCEIE